jgi:ribonuclease P protein subunit RPR2
MSKRFNRKKELQKKIAKQRIKRLFLLAEYNAINNRLILSDRYVFLARKISMKYLVPVPNQFKRKFCKHCYKYLLPNVTGRIRIHKGRIVSYCYKCKRYMRIPLNNRMTKQSFNKSIKDV